MKDRIVKFLILTLATSFVICCAEKNTVLDVTKTNSNENQNSEQRRYEAIWQKLFFREINERIEGTEITNLRDLELPPDSKEIRIWVGFDLSPLRGLILKQNNEEWSALVLPPLDSSNTLRNPQILLPPKNGWANLWKKLEQLEIMTLPDPIDYGDIDGRGVVVEIKSGNSYRTYQYSINNRTGDNYKKIKEICETLSNEFDIELLKYFMSKN